jgi:hypothetical protein
MSSTHRFLVVLALATSISACKEQPKADPARIDRGAGWYCHRHPGGSDSLCWRTESQCDAMLTTYAATNASYAKESCKPQPVAWCFVRDPSEPVPVSCKIDETSCREKSEYWNSGFARVFGSHAGASECFEVR